MIDGGRLRLQRWTTAIGLLSTAELSARVDTPESNAVALLVAHSACESMLGLLAGVRRDKRNEDVPFSELLASARRKCPELQPELADLLEAMHRMRNAFVHASNAVHRDEAERALGSARALADIATVSVQAGSRSPAGFASAVAAATDVEPVAMWLRHADEMLAAGQPGLAADACVRALDAALRRTRPPLYTDDTLSRDVRLSDLRGVGFDRHARRVAARIEGLEAWVVPLTLGLSPAAYSRIHQGAGRIVPLYGAAVMPVDRTVRNPPEPEVRSVLRVVAQAVFRLWASGSLRSAKWDAEEVERARPYFEDPIAVTEKTLSMTHYGRQERSVKP